MKNGHWFKADSHGFGWSPATWQGWLILITYIVFIVGMFFKIDTVSHSGSDTIIGMVIPFLFATGILFALCLLTGEKPSWRRVSKKKH
ncbi:MAG: hypothetical protein HY430_00890 [Candidatus Levybacteria bacterium]|nr:hypothetical protein [Candidatus Levybacteria bacterium]